MSAERKADMEAALTELAFEIELAIKQGRIADAFHWSTPATGPDDAPWVATLTIIPRRRPYMKPPASMKTIIETIFDALGDAGEREGVDVQDVAVALLERFDISEHEGPGDGN
jgi:hypothetical protein